MSLVEMLQKIRTEIKREFLSWAFGCEIAQGIGYGRIMIVIHAGRITDVDVTLSERPTATNKPNG